MAQSTVESKNKKDINNGKAPAKETILSPRFYTTDFEAMENMDLSINEEELEAICEEFRKDYNRHHFVRNSCLLYTSPSPRDLSTSRMPSSA